MEQPEDIREVMNGLDLEVEFRASGHKSSEGDGRTAADIRRELEEAKNDGAE